jgi:alkaline phosphatase D
MNTKKLVFNQFFMLIAIIFNSLLAYGQIEKLVWPDPVANHVFPINSSDLTHGPLLGKPTANSMRVWIRTKKPREFSIVYDTKLPISPESISVRGNTSEEDDNTGYVDLTGLKPNTEYYYGVVMDGHLIDTRMDYEPGFHSFHTLPSSEMFKAVSNPEGLFNFCFGTGFGNNKNSDYRSGECPAYYQLLRNHKNLSFFFFNGDYIYEEERQKSRPPWELDIYRKDYKIYMDRDDQMVNYFRQVPFLQMYDDHEIGPEKGGTGEIGLKEGVWLYRDAGLKPWYEYAGWSNYDSHTRQSVIRSTASVKKGSDLLQDASGDFLQLRKEAISNIHVWTNQKNSGVYEFKEIVDSHTIRISPEFSHDEEVLYSIGTHHYFDWQITNCHFFALDTRGERTRYLPEKAHDYDQFILGETQKKWLKDKITSSDADFIFIFSTVSWMIYHTNFHMYINSDEEPKTVKGRSVKEDGFTGAVKERDELLKFFDDLEKPVIIFTGDLHNAFAIQISDNVWEFMIGPINSGNHPIATAGNPPYGGWFDSEGWPVKIKWVSGFPNELNYKEMRNKYYGVIQVNNVIKTAIPKKEGIQWVAYDEPQVIVRCHDAYNGNIIYAEGISTLDAKKDRKIIKPSVK